MGARLLEFPNRFTAYSIHPIELELDSMILDISPLNRSKQDFSISFQRALWGRASCNLEIGLQFLRDGAETWWDDTEYQSAQSCGAGFFDFSPEGAVGRGAPPDIFQSIPRLQFLCD